MADFQNNFPIQNSHVMRFGLFVLWNSHSAVIGLGAKTTWLGLEKKSLRLTSKCWTFMRASLLATKNSANRSRSFRACYKERIHSTLKWQRSHNPGAEVERKISVWRAV